jgi:hypothetical protein
MFKKATLAMNNENLSFPRHLHFPIHDVYIGTKILLFSIQSSKNDMQNLLHFVLIALAVVKPTVNAKIAPVVPQATVTAFDSEAHAQRLNTNPSDCHVKGDGATYASRDCN